MLVYGWHTSLGPFKKRKPLASPSSITHRSSSWNLVVRFPNRVFTHRNYIISRAHRAARPPRLSNITRKVFWFYIKHICCVKSWNAQLLQPWTTLLLPHIPQVIRSRRYSRGCYDTPSHLDVCGYVFYAFDRWLTFCNITVYSTSTGDIKKKLMAAAGEIAAATVGL